MNRDPVKPILDSLLEEVLCELNPPDVTDRVLRALDEVPSLAPPTLAPATPKAADHTSLGKKGTDALTNPTPSLLSPTAVVTPAAQGHAPNWMSPVFWMACGAASVVLIAALSVLVLQLNGPDRRVADDLPDNKTNDPRFVERDAFPGTNLAQESPSSSENKNRRDGDLVVENDRDKGTTRDRGTPRSASDSTNRLRDDSPFREAPPFGRDRSATDGLATDRGDKSIQSLDDAQVVQFVNRVIEREIDRQQVMPAPRISDRAWMTRVCQVLLGRDPSEQESLLFDQAPSDTRRSWFAEQILNHDLYQEEFSERWGRILAEQWSTSKSPTTQPLLARYLSDSIAIRKGLDSMVASLLTATGSTNPNDESFNPATALLAEFTGDANHQQLTGEVARQFLGRRLDCAKCHDHALASEWKQADYWEMNAFFRQLKVQQTPEGQISVSDVDFAGDANNLDDAVVFFEDQSGELRAAHPRLDEQRFGSSGRVADLNRRRTLAEHLVQANDFRRVIVNRIWSECFHVGFSRPSDELGTHNPVSHPELLQGLADQFAAHDYRLRPLLKWMVLSEPFQRAQAESWDFAMDSPHLGHRPLFSRYYREWGRPVDASQALALVVKQRDALARYEPGMNGILANVPSVPGEEIANTSSTEPELDADLANAFVLRTQENPWGVSGNYARLLTSLSNHESMSVDDRVRHLFQLAVNREPTARELDDARQLITYQQQRDSARGLQLGLQDVWWTLMMSAEFHH